MALWSTGFADTANGVLPSYLTSRWATPTTAEANDFEKVSGAQAVWQNGETVFSLFPKYLLLKNNNYTRSAFEITSVTPDATEEVYTSIVRGGGTAYPALICYGAGTTEAGRTGYTAFLTADKLVLRRMDNGSEATIDDVLITVPTDRVIYLKLRVEPEGSDVRVKAWYSETRTDFSGAPTVNYLDTAPLAVGWVGLGNLSNGNYDERFGTLRVATGTDTITVPPLPGGQYFNDFSSETLATVPNWMFKDIWATSSTAEVEGDTLGYTDTETQDVMLPQQFALRQGGQYDRAAVITMPLLPHTASQEIYTTITYASLSNDNIPSLVLRGRNTVGNNSEGYIVLLRIGSYGDVAMRRAEAGSETTIASAPMPAGLSAETVMYTRFRCDEDGTDLRIRLWIWFSGETEPTTPFLEYTDTSPLIPGWMGIMDLSSGTGDISRFGSVGLSNDGTSAPTAPIAGGESGDLISSASSSDTWAATCLSPANMTATALASDSLNAIATVTTSILAAAQASDSAGELPDTAVSFISAATGNGTLDALASAAAALSAGAAAGESWTVQAQVVVNLLDQGVASDQIRRQTDSAINAALAEQSAAADQFLAAVNGIAALTETATVNDAYVAVVAQLGSIASGAVADDSFNLTFGYALALQSGALSGDAWALMATLASALSEACTADDLLQAKAIVTTRVRAGAVATSRFAIVNAGIRYLVMGSIILRDALNCRVTHKPALNQSVKIKPGH